jgi:hypothetical protein
MIKNFIAKTVCYLFLLTIILIVFDFMIDNGLKKSKSIYFENSSKLFSGKIGADIIISGSSKGYSHISPKIIDKILNVNSYNLSLDGNGFFTQKTYIEKYLKHNTSPKMIIQVVSNATLSNKAEIYLYQKFLPYYDDPDIRKMINKSGKNIHPFVNFIPFAKWNGQKLFVVEGLLSFFGITFSNNLYKGYHTNEKNWDSNSYNKFIEFQSNKTHSSSYENSFDPYIKNILEEYILSCKKNNIELVLVYPPLYYLSDNYGTTQYEELAKKYDIKFFDFSYNQKLSFDKRFFSDSQHLNKNGAEIFTTELAKIIKDSLK